MYDFSHMRVFITGSVVGFSLGREDSLEKGVAGSC